MKIYKYVHEDRVSFFDNGLIRFTPPKAFNDPFEFRPYVKEITDDSSLTTYVEENFDQLMLQEYEKLSPDIKSKLPFSVFKAYGNSRKGLMSEGVKALSKMFTPSFGNAINDKLCDIVGVLSLTERRENILMWAHYANSHQGLVIEFDGKHSFFDQRKSAKDEFRHLRKVIYSKERPKISIKETKGIQDFITKGEDWEYEEEWRMLLPLESYDEKINSIPYDIHLFKIPFKAVKAVIFGEKTSEETKTSVLTSIRNNESISHIKVLQASIDTQEYKININKY